MLQAGFIFALLFVAFILLSNDAISSSTREILTERRLAAEQTAHRLDLVLEQSFLLVQRRVPPGFSFSTNPGTGPGIARRVYPELLLSPAYVAVYDRQGVLRDTEPPSLHLQEIDALPIRDALERGTPTVTGLLPDLRGKGRAVYLLFPIRNETGATLGLILAAIDPANSNLDEFLQSFSLGATGFAELVDEKGFVLATTQRAGLFQKGDHADQFATLIQDRRSSVGTCHRCHDSTGGEVKKEQEVLAFAPLQRAAWGVAIRQPEEEALAPVRAVQMRFFFLGLASLCGIVVVSWRASRRLAQSARQLQERASGLARGDLETPIPPPRGAEMIQLANTLEQTRQELQASWQELERSNRELQQRVDAKTIELGSIVRASESLVSAGGPDTLLGFVVRIAAQTFHADAAVLFLWDAQRGGLVARASTGYDTQALAQVALQPGEGIAGKVFKRGKPAMSDNAAEVERLLGDLSAENRRYLLWARGGNEPRSFICVPVENRGQVLGDIFLAGFQDGTQLSRSNLELACTFARIVSALQENFRLLHETSQAEALRRADQIKTEFFSNTSHELQTPLASLKASLDLLPPAFSSDDVEARAALVENARRSADRLQRLVGDLIDVARLQNLHLKLDLDVIDLRDVLQQAVCKFEPLTDKKGQTLKLFSPEAASLVVADPRRVEQVLGNLLMNAHQYTPQGGHITISVQDQSEEFVVSIADTGPGIAPRDKVRLFERFYRGASDGVPSGLGLGLAIAKGLVELHGGRIWVESGRAKGSIFCFSLPKASLNEDFDR
ncbi:MAG: ATP-binding protein [Chloroflexi bacterium]|nr:ATP-binding protein [Chloroflexota bacterium]